MKVIAISDTHCFPLSELKLPEADLLVHAGDLTFRGTERELEAVNEEIKIVSNRYTYGVVVIAGNHDFIFQNNRFYAKALLSEATYLRDEEVTIGGKRIYGTPWQPWFHDWAFNLPKGGYELQEKWDMIPPGLDLLLTHGPPHGILDKVNRLMIGEEDPHVGCELLAKRVIAVEPKWHVFGHIHEAAGHIKLGNTEYLNASTCNLKYRPVNPPHVIEL